MKGAKGEVHQLVLAKFKDEINDVQIDELIKGYANLVNLIPSMKAFHWSRDLSTENASDGYTHIFDSTFESTEGVEEYVVHPAHIEFGNIMTPSIEKILVVVFKPTPVDL